jgi:hypothetical protein
VTLYLRGPLEHCSIPAIFPRDKKRVTENYVLKVPNSPFPKFHLMSPFFHGHYKDLYQGANHLHDRAGMLVSLDISSSK